MNDKCIVKKTFFSIISFEYPVPLNMRLLMQLRSATVEKKWPVFLQNASGNLKSSTNNFQVNRAFKCKPNKYVSANQQNYLKNLSHFSF